MPASIKFIGIKNSEFSDGESDKGNKRIKKSNHLPIRHQSPPLKVSSIHLHLHSTHNTVKGKCNQNWLPLRTCAKDEYVFMNDCIKKKPIKNGTAPKSKV